MNHIVFIVGARPNFMKLSPVYDALKRKNRFKLTIIHTGQHYDHLMSDIFFEQLNLPKDITYLNVKGGSQCQQLGEMLIGLDNLFNNINPDLVVVFGDVTSTLAGGLAAQKNGIRLTHIESGNRSFDKTMPEEVNRIIVDSITDFFFVSEPNGIDNLVKEGLINVNNYRYVGNPMIDTLIRFRFNARSLLYYKRFGLEPKNYVLMTVHRPSNVDDNEQFQKMVRCINLLSEKYKIVFPVHHRKRAKFLEYFSDNRNVVLIEPLGYIEFMSLTIYSGLVITDSGGLQEETTVLKVPCITLRPNTERPITCTNGTNYLMTSIDNSKNVLSKAIEMFNKDFSGIESIDLWDGGAGERIAETIVEIMGKK